MSDGSGWFFILITSAILASLLTDRHVYPYEFEKARKHCVESNSELDHFELGTFETEVHCLNGATFVYETSKKYGETK